MTNVASMSPSTGRPLEPCHVNMKIKLSPCFGHKALALVLCVFLGLIGTSLHAAEYGRHDLTRLLKPNPQPGGGTMMNISLLDRLLGDLGQHAANYPPNFDSAEDAARAKQDAIVLMDLLAAAFFKVSTPPPEVLLRMGMLGAIGHNLDAPGAALYAQAQFVKLLNASPDHAAGNLHYGTFLSATNRPQEALPYLTKAQEKGVVSAMYALGMTHLALGNTAKALESLQAYQKAVPADTSVPKLIEALRSGKLELRKSGAP